MKIAYRRMSGAIGVTNNEVGTRGMWLEKRMALVGFLRSRKHTVDYIGRMTKASKQFEKKIKLNHDILMVEFGSSNGLSYGEDLAETILLCEKHKGIKIFICDDPDLPFLWNKVDPSQFSAWYNCTNPQKLGGQPENVKLYDFPFSALQTPKKTSIFYRKDKLVYIGRPFGREEEVNALITGKVPWMAYGDKKHWEDFSVMVASAPNQSIRSDFYNKSFGSIALCDKKHIKFGWRTGRAYHSALAGCPALVFSQEINPGLSHFIHCKNTKEILELCSLWQNKKERDKAVEQEVEGIIREKKIVIKVLEGFGL